MADPPESEQSERKDRLIQARVARDLETTLKAEAKRRRLSVSHLIRNVLEDAFDLVDGVVSDAEQIVSDSVHLARNVGRNAVRLSRNAARQDAAPEVPEVPEEPDDLSHVDAWNEVVLNRAMPCARCGDEIARGTRGYIGLSSDPQAGRAWLCSACVADL